MKKKINKITSAPVTDGRVFLSAPVFVVHNHSEQNKANRNVLCCCPAWSTMAEKRKGVYYEICG